MRPLPALIGEHLNQVLELCSRHRVRRLELFGSAARDGFDPASSDLDFLVEFREIPQGARAKAYFGLLEDLGNLFGCRIDLVMPSAIRNPFFRESIRADRTLLYAA